MYSITTGGVNNLEEAEYYQQKIQAYIKMFLLLLAGKLYRYL
jgi:hypothetical protein